MRNPFTKAYVQPSVGDVHISVPLTNVAIAYVQSSTDFVARRAFPGIPVGKQSDRYYVYDRGTFNNDSMAERAPATETAGITHKLSTDTYFSDVWGLHVDVADQVTANQDMPLDMDRDAATLIMRAGLIRQEKEWADTVFRDDAWTMRADGVGSSPTSAADLDLTNNANNNVMQWNDASSTPIEDIRLYKELVVERTGFEPNVLVLGNQAYNRLLDHPDIIARLDRGQTTGPVVANRDSLAALFELEDVLTMKGVYNMAAEGAATQNVYINGRSGLLFYRPMSPGVLIPSAGYTFVWTSYAGMSDEGARIKRFRMENYSSDRVEGELAFDHKITGTDLGVYLKEIVA